MSNYNNSLRSVVQNNSKASKFEGNENNFVSISDSINVHRSPLSTGKREASFSIVSRRTSVENSDIFADVTNFKLQDDPSFRNDLNSQIETISNSSDSTGVILPSSQQEDVVQQHKGDHEIGSILLLQSSCAFQEADVNISNKALETEQVSPIEELRLVQQEYHSLRDILSKQDKEEQRTTSALDNSIRKYKTQLSPLHDGSEAINVKDLQVKLDKITGDLEDAQTLNSQYLDNVSHLPVKHQNELIYDEGKFELNTKTTHLLEEVVVFHSELMKKLYLVAEDNDKLKFKVAAKEEKIKEINADWEKASLELTSFLLDGSKSMRDVSDQIEHIAGSFDHVNVGISKHIENAAKFCVEKEEKISLLERCLEDAQKTVLQMERNLLSLKGAAMVLSEFQQLDKASTKGYIQMTTTLNDKIKITPSENILTCKEEISEENNCRDSNLLEVNMKADCTRPNLGDDEISTRNGSQQIMDVKGSLLLENSGVQAEQEKLGLPQCDSAVNMSFADPEIGNHSPGVDSCWLGSDALSNKDQNELKKAKMIGVLRPVELVMHEANADCCDINEFVADGRVSQASGFFKQFEEAHAAMQEAEVMINALLKSNENSRHLTAMWKQSCEDLMAEKAGLIEEIEHLKSSIQLKDRENKELHDQIRFSLVEMSNMMSLLEGSFMHLQGDMEATCKAIYMDSFMLAKEIQSVVVFSRSSVEDICAQVMQKGFAYSVFHQFSVAENFRNYRSLDGDVDHYADRLGDCLNNHLHRSNREDTSLKTVEIQGDQSAGATTIEAVDMGVADDKVYKHSELQKELEHVEFMLQAILSDFIVLQKSTSGTGGPHIKTETLVPSLSQTWHELKMKTSQLEVLFVQNTKLKCCLLGTDTALVASNTDLEQLKEKGEAINVLENKVVLAKSSVETQLLSLLEGIENDLRIVTDERDRLGKQVVSLQERLDMACALAEKGEATAVESHQEAEASKIYAEQKEEEVKILKQLVEELECTINVLEKKVCEMEEVKRHQQISELELQALKQRPSAIKNITKSRDSLNSTTEPAEYQLSRKLHDKSLELHEEHKQIITLQEELAEQTKEIEWCKGYISELVLHAEAQASHYQQKFKTLEAMVREIKIESSNQASASPNLNRTEKRSSRTRRSNSPFRCMMGGLVQQKHLEKDNELTTAMFRIQELEALLVGRQKEVCLLNTRLAATESMTHDIIRDLLGVKLDMTNYANLMDHHHFQKLVKDTRQQTHEFIAMEKEILNLKRRIKDLIEERDICILEVNRREADICAIQMDVEQIQERQQLLIAENALLKMDKINLHRRVTELDNIVKKVFGTPTKQPKVQQQIDCLLNSRHIDFRERPINSESQFRRANNEVSHYYKSESSRSQAKLERGSS